MNSAAFLLGSQPDRPLPFHKLARLRFDVAEDDFIGRSVTFTASPTTRQQYLNHIISVPYDSEPDRSQAAKWPVLTLPARR